MHRKNFYNLLFLICFDSAKMLKGAVLRTIKVGKKGFCTLILIIMVSAHRLFNQLKDFPSPVIIVEKYI